MAECRTLGGCATGEAKLTGGYNLSARYVIHTVGPVWQGGQQNEDEFLARCYRNSLALAEQHKLQTIAFPSISTGGYGFPIQRASRIALREIQRVLEATIVIETVIAVCFSPADYQEYLAAQREILGAI